MYLLSIGMWSDVMGRLCTVTEYSNVLKYRDVV